MQPNSKNITNYWTGIINSNAPSFQLIKKENHFPNDKELKRNMAIMYFMGIILVY